MRPVDLGGRSGLEGRVLGFGEGGVRCAESVIPVEDAYPGVGEVGGEGGADEIAVTLTFCLISRVFFEDVRRFLTISSYLSFW